MTITGTGFTGATTVDFGTVSATSFVIVSSTSITAMSPEESVGTVNVTVVTAGGTSTISIADQFTFRPSPGATTDAATSVDSSGAAVNGSVKPTARPRRITSSTARLLPMARPPARQAPGQVRAR